LMVYCSGSELDFQEGFCKTACHGGGRRH
jgi:hypothetical protein